MNRKPNNSKQANDSVRQKAKRNQFTMPEEDDELIDFLQNRYQRLMVPHTTKKVEITKSQIVRAGIRLLKTLKDNRFQKAVEGVEKLPEGRQKNS